MSPRPPVRPSRRAPSSLSAAVRPALRAALVAALAVGLAALGACGDGLLGPLGTDPLNPTQDSDLEGTHSGSTFTVPSDVTVTLTGNTSVQVQDSVRIEGTVEGDCQGFEVQSQGPVVVTGTVRNDCTELPDGEAPSLLIATADTLSVDATIRSSGDVVIGNDPDVLADADSLLGLAAVPGRAAGPGRTSHVTRRGCDLSGDWRALPQNAHKGADGEEADDGRPGSSFLLFCGATLEMEDLTVAAQGGGRGGTGIHESNGEAFATGGDGETGGDVTVVASSGMAVRGDVRLNAGDGGFGGLALALAGESSEGASAPRAVALGGQGADGGTIRLTPGPDKSVTLVGTLTLNQGSLARSGWGFGAGGSGGGALAVGAGGQDATASRAAQHGGDASAGGGDGGQTGEVVIEGTLVGTPVLEGLAADGGKLAGDGGTAAAAPGNGGAGSVDFPTGGNGGNAIANAGDGGDNRIFEVRGTEPLYGRGRPGRVIFGLDPGAPVPLGAPDDLTLDVVSGSGGVGYVDCLETIRPGGDGGQGGNLEGDEGLFGTGVDRGLGGRDASLWKIGNGGPGGDGDPAGAGGPAGSSSFSPAPDTELRSAVPLLQDGSDGSLCSATANEPPVVTINRPELTLYTAGNPIPFEGEAEDPEDGFITDPSSLEWLRIAPDGTRTTIGQGTSFQRDDLPPGSWIIRLEATDSDGATGTDQTEIRVNDPPVVTINNPAPGTTLTDEPSEILLEATADDLEDGPLDGVPADIQAELVDQDGSTTTTAVSGGVEWFRGDVQVDVHPVIFGPSASTSSVTVSVSGTDSDGATGSDQATYPVEHLPDPVIDSPADGDAFTAGDPISFAGSASDVEDGTLSGSSLVWSSDLDGQIGTGTSFSRDDLSEGTHTISLTATDSDGHSDAVSVSIDVNPAPQTSQIRAGQSDFSTSEGALVTMPSDGSGSATPFVGPVSGEEFFGGMDAGSMVYVRSTTFGDPSTADLWHAADDGTGATNLTSQQAFYRRGSASPDGTQVVFESDRDDPQTTPAGVLHDVFVMNVDGTGTTKVVTEAGFPSFTPAGRIVYSTDADADGHYEVRIADADGTNASLLIDDDDANSFSFSEAVVSPDGTRIAVTRDNTSTFEAVVLVGDFDGTSITNLARLETGGDSFQPAWSPASDQVAFASARTGGAWEIYVSDLSGTTVVNVSNTADKYEFHPFWGVP